MAAALHSVLGAGVILPHDLLPDDTKLVYWRSLDSVEEIDYDDSDDDIVTDWNDHDRYANLALASYNEKHHTDYKLVKVEGGRWCYESECSATRDIIHCGFAASQSTDAECGSSFKNFFAVVEQPKPSGEVVISSCCIADGLKTIGCKSCDFAMCKPLDPRENCEKVDCAKSREFDPPLSQYAHCLADGVNLSEKAQWRVSYALLALAHYNKRHRTDYKLVDALPFCSTIETSCVTHCNFIARQNSPADDVSNKLFFAELEQPRDRWLVTACRIIHGCKTTAGCYLCDGRRGKRVVHPTRGFRFGRHCPIYRPLRRRLC